MNFPRFRIALCQKRFFSNICDPKGLFTCRYNNRPLIYNLADDRLVSTCEVKTRPKISIIQRIFKKIPFLNVDRVKTKAAGYLLYQNVADKIDFIEFIEKCDLPDTFYSWFVITEVHVWMLSARSMAEEEHGQFLRNSILEALWADVAKRSKKLGAGNPAAMKAQIQELSEQLQAAFIGYDEGLQSDDTVLAGAIWRTIYQNQYASPYHLEAMVKYIRKHMVMLDNLTREQIMDVNPVKWEPI